MNNTYDEYTSHNNPLFLIFVPAMIALSVKTFLVAYLSLFL